MLFVQYSGWFSHLQQMVLDASSQFQILPCSTRESRKSHQPYTIRVNLGKFWLLILRKSKLHRSKEGGFVATFQLAPGPSHGTCRKEGSQITEAAAHIPLINENARILKHAIYETSPPNVHDLQKRQYLSCNFNLVLATFFWSQFYSPENLL